jgi:hypothetical protein
MVYITLIDLLILARSGDSGGYGIAPNSMLLIMVGAIPPQLISTIGLLYSGRRTSVAVEILTTLIYVVISAGLWWNNTLVRRFAIGFYGIELALLSFYLVYVIPLFWNSWSIELRVFSVISGLMFLAILLAGMNYC